MGLTITVGLSFTPLGVVYAGMIGGAIGAAFNGGNIFVGACLGALGGGATIAGPFSQVLWSGMEAQMTGGSAGRSMLATAIGFGSDSTGGLVGAMILGGVSSEITGGKFENGAATAAFSYLMRMAAEKAKAGGVQEIKDTRGTIEKWKDHQVSFDVDQERMIIQGADLAKEYLENKLAVLDGVDHDAENFKLLFGDTSDSARTLIRGYITRELKALDELDIHHFKMGSECSCSAQFDVDSPMFVKGNKMPIYINPNAFERSPELMARALIHELSHIATIGATEDFRYGYENALKTAKEEPRAALRNADSFSYYVTGHKK